MRETATGVLSQLSFILMIAIWIQSASILTKAFTGLLLNTYFRSDFGPIVSTLEDVYENRGLSLVSDEGMQSTWIKRSNIGQDKIDSLVYRMKNEGFPLQMKNLSIVKSIFQGKSVMFTHSKNVDSFCNIYQDFSEMFYVSERKYLPSFQSLITRKNHFTTHNIRFL